MAEFRVRVLKALFYHGEKREPGDVLSVPALDALDLIGGRAELVDKSELAAVMEEAKKETARMLRSLDSGASRLMQARRSGNWQ